MGHFRPLFSLFSSFQQLTVNKFIINFANDWIRTAHERLYLFESKAKSLATAGGDYWSADTFVLTTNCALDPLLVDIYLKAHSHSLPLTLWRAADSCIAHREIKNSTVESGDHLVESE